MKTIVISVEGLTINAQLTESLTADAIYGALPLEGWVNVWGEEIYFEIPLSLELEADAREEVEIGSLAYWPSGPAFCIFFGRTPVSAGEKPRAYSAVNVFGEITSGADQLKAVPDGAKICVTAST